MTTATTDSVSADLHEAAGFLGTDPQLLAAVDSTVAERIAVKAHEFRQLQAQNLESSVIVDELRSASSRKLDACKTQIQSLLQELETLRAESCGFEDTRRALESQCQKAQNEAQTSQLHAQTLLEQKQMLQSSKNDLAGLLNEKIQESTALKHETDTLLTETRQLRGKCLELETLARDFKSQLLNSKSDFHRLSQELQLSKSNNEWLESQLAQQNSAFNAYRQKSQQEIAQLRQKSESCTAELQSRLETVATLRDQNAAVTKHLESQLDKVKHLTDELNKEKHEFAREMGLKQRLIDLLENQVQSLKNELELKTTAARANSDSSELIEELSQTKDQLAARELEIQKLQDTVQELLSTTSTTDNENQTTNVNTMARSPEKSISIPQLYGDISILKKQVIHEKRQKEHLQYQVEAFVVELESKVPMLSSFKDRNSMLERELSETALMLESVSEDKEGLSTDLERARTQLIDYESQLSKLTQQRSDLAHQVQYLLINISVKNDSKGPLTAEEMAFVKKIIDSEDSPLHHDTQDIISQRLVEFQDIVELQSKNSDLLLTVRSLADKLEAEEQQAKSKTESLENDLINDAKEAITTLQDHVQELESRIEVITKERDAFKAAHSYSPTGVQVKMQNGTGKSDDSARVEELAHHLQIAKQEAENNMKLLNSEIHELLKSKTELLVEVEQQKSSKSLAEERLKIAQGSLTLAKQECNELNRRYHKLQDNSAKQDAKTQETISEVIDCKSQIASLTAELKISVSNSEFLRSSHEKTKETNDQLIKERNELSILVAQLQTLQKERDTNLKEAEKNFKEKLGDLDVEINQLRGQLSTKNQEFNDYISASDSKIQWYQEKIDSLNATLTATVAKLSTITETMQNLESQHKVLEIKLMESETKNQSYSVINQTSDVLVQTETLRNELEKTKISLKDAYSQVDEYKNLYTSTGENLSSITAAFEDLKTRHNGEIEGMKKMEESLREEIFALRNHLSELNAELNHEKEEYNSKKKDYDEQLNTLKISQESIDAIKHQYQQQVNQLTSDLNEQASFANKAQENYEQELQRHADVSKTISQLREQSQTYKNEVQSLKSSNKEFQRILEENEESWARQKQNYESRLDTMNQRVEDLLTQNRLLFDQLDLKSIRDTPENDPSGMQSDIRELISTLRRECDIYQTKLEVVKRDESLLQRKLQISEAELLAAKEELNNYQASADKNSYLAEEHNKILEQLNQLNLLRESNITLRNDLQSKSKQNQTLAAKVEELQAVINPLESELSSLKRSMATKDKQLSLMSEETERWKQRSQDILHTYERVDPEEHKKMIDELLQIKNELAEKTDQNTELEDRFQRLKKQARERLDTARAAQTSLATELAELREAKDIAEAALEKERENSKTLQGVIDAWEQSNTAGDSEIQGDLNAALQKLADSNAKIENLEKQPIVSDNELIMELESLKKQVVELETLLGQAQEKVQTLENAKNTSMADNSADIEKVRTQLTEHSEKLIAEREAQLKKKYEEAEAEQAQLFEQKLKDVLHQSPENIEGLKKEWEAEFEQLTQKRIEEANELLRKRIRLPTEEKINKIIETRKKELEQEFEARVQQRASEIASQNCKTPDSAEITGKHQQELENMKTELRNQMDEEMAQLKKKAFDEGKQQATMKSMFLEKKLPNWRHNLNRAVETRQPVPQVVQVRLNPRDRVELWRFCLTSKQTRAKNRVSREKVH
ncbi:LANO_0E05666g1_1 [Lachancea nothofagi CBS 11611]|uniref:LANO_0E05666g1_1 n=1 Tax=Lachancea nothofagi CBS 11611 TaxID=1266666 RepID=A0A1G4JTL3_9SACH|nr:LANO_0E05666g1_1 [Lachancea nothofagi CBS 11611]